MGKQMWRGIIIGLLVALLGFAIVDGLNGQMERKNAESEEKETESKDVSHLEEQSERIYNYVEGVPLNDVAQMNDLVMFEFRAEWCPYCKELEERLPDYIKEREALTVLKIDVDEFPGLAKEFQAVSTPTLYLFENGKAISQTKGALPNEVLDEWIHTETKEVDMAVSYGEEE